MLRKLIRRAVRHAELLKGTDQGLAQSLIEATDRVSDVMGRRWKDVGPGEGGDVAKATIEKESSKFAKTLKKGVDHLQELADESTVVRRRPRLPPRRHARLPGRAVGRGGPAHRHDDRRGVAAPLRGAPARSSGPGSRGWVTGSVGGGGGGPVRQRRGGPAGPGQAPLAARLRPRTLDDVVGQDAAAGARAGRCGPSSRPTGSTQRDLLGPARHGQDDAGPPHRRRHPQGLRAAQRGQRARSRTCGR